METGCAFDAMRHAFASDEQGGSMLPKWLQCAIPAGSDASIVGRSFALFLIVNAVALLALHTWIAPRDAGAGLGVALPTPSAVPAVALTSLRSEPARILHEDALAGFVARKYRVSEEATRDVVGMAYREARRNELDPLLILAVIAIESRFNPIAQSEGGAMGLMQIIPRFHADKFDASNRGAILDPDTNIAVGAKVLKEYIRRGGSETAGLQLYNGSFDDATNGYAEKVFGERARLKDVVRKARERDRA
jgi:soluble lytic murein transglycosylase-like protein